MSVRLAGVLYFSFSCFATCDTRLALFLGENSFQDGILSLGLYLQRIFLWARFIL
jgi:hypothetical protein